MGFMNITMQEMLAHLRVWGSEVETYDKEARLEEHNHPWTLSKHPITYFNWVTRVIKQLHVAGIMSSEAECKDCALIAFKKCTDFDKIMDEWDKKPSLNQTWTNLKTFVDDECNKLKAVLD